MTEQLISRFFVAGISYRTADAVQRGQFAISESAYALMLEDAKSRHIRSLIAISTCNRSEIYAFATEEQMVKDLFLKYTNGSAQLFNESGFIKKGAAAFEHLFYMAAGIDSQILGDYEILGQLKKAVAFSRNYGMIGPVMDRTINIAQQASKTVKTKTAFSSGTVSVSYAAVEWLKEHEHINKKSILLFGTGKFGRNIAKNLRHYFTSDVTIINRTDEIAKQFAADTGIAWQPFSSLKENIRKADIIIVCTNAGHYTIFPEYFAGDKHQCIMDISVPVNVHPGVKNINGISVAGIDEISKILQSTQFKRLAELPKAKAIVAAHLEELNAWLEMQRYTPIIRELKAKLEHLGDRMYKNESPLRFRVNKTISKLAVNLRQKNEKGCVYIHAFKDFLQPGIIE